MINNSIPSPVISPTKQGQGEEGLDVYIAGVHCGTLTEDKNGAISFTYRPDYDGIPLSLSMPVGLARYGDRIVRPYLMGLLPDNESVRASIGAQYGISGDNPFRILRIMGLDCPGAVQVHPTGKPLPAENSTQDLTPVSDTWIADKLRAVKDDAASAWIDADSTSGLGRWSLGGCQAKFALRLSNGRWCDCAGASATTHILKPGVTGYEHQALVEYLSMKIAGELGLPVADVDFHVYDDEPTIIIERYDRVRYVDGTVKRIHQEDLCQALSVPPERKYADQGGPSTPDILALLSTTGTNAQENVHRFMLYLFFNYLIGATDAHAKNHSLLFTSKGDVKLAPLYDVASIAPYESLRTKKRKPVRAALSIGGENRFGMVGRGCVEKMVETCHLEELGIGTSLLCGQLRTMANLLPKACSKVLSIAQADGLPGAAEVATPFEQEVTANCNRTLDRL